MEDNINHPRHYTGGLVSAHIECIDITRHLSFTQGNAVKYVWRAGRKGDSDTALEDLEKALWYLDDWETSGPYCPPVSEPAHAIVRLLPARDQVSELGRLRAEAIHSIVHGLTHAARIQIGKMQEIIRNDREQSLPGMR
jgi:hypothetical protein